MATSDQIVGAAVGLGEQKSWEAVRLHDVAAVLGISLDDLRTHFREKEDIVDAWFEMPRISGAPWKKPGSPRFIWPRLSTG